MWPKIFILQWRSPYAEAETHSNSHIQAVLEPDPDLRAPLFHSSVLFTIIQAPPFFSSDLCLNPSFPRGLSFIMKELVGMRVDARNVFINVVAEIQAGKVSWNRGTVEEVEKAAHIPDKVGSSKWNEEKRRNKDEYGVWGRNNEVVGRTIHGPQL